MASLSSSVDANGL